jgi:L-ascorbate metabolism protein UlaG (beta-lactamase superfamily)
MNIQYYGDYCFKITTKPAGRATDDVVIWTDLPDKSTGLRTPFGHADIALLSHMDKDSESLSSLKDAPTILHTPGEYSVKGVPVLGFPSSRDEELGAKRGSNTVFIFESEEVKLCFLGALGHPLDEKTIGKIGDADVLFVPIGDGDTLPAKQVDELVRQIEPRVVIPMHYRLEGMDASVGGAETFCKEVGCNVAGAADKFNFKKKDIEEKNMEVMFLAKA